LTSEPAVTLGQSPAAGLLISPECEPSGSRGAGFTVSVHPDGNILLGYRSEKLDGSDAYDSDHSHRGPALPGSADPFAPRRVA
jgi:hypothetical protein